MDHTPFSGAKRLIGLLLFALAACGPAPQGEGAESPARAESAITTREGPPPSGGEPRASEAGGPATARTPSGPAPLVPRIRVEGEKGERLEGAQAALEPARERLKECVPDKRGVLQLRIQTGPSRTSMNVDPSSSLGGATSRCVLETLSTMDVDEALRQGSPSDRPSRGFNSIVQVEW